MKLLVAVFFCLLATINGQLPEDLCTQDQVELEEQFCGDCLTVFRCLTVGEAPAEVASCIVGEACGPIGDTNDCTAIGNTPCSCTDLVCDPYTTSSVDVCTPVGILGIDPCDGETCIDGACVAIPATTTTPEPTTTEAPTCTGVSATGTFVPITPDCKTGMYCISETSDPFVFPTTCGDGEYFESAVSGCVSLPPDNCVGCSHSQCPDKLDCNKYVICSNGEQVEVNQCEEGEFYDSTSRLCGTDEANCDIMTQCVFDDLPSTSTSDSTASSVSSDSTASSVSSDSTASSVSSDSTASSDSSDTTDSSDSSSSNDSTSSPSSTADPTTMPETCTEDNADEYYPFEGDCKMYWNCREIEPDVYAYVSGTCFSTLLFNPVTSLCDSPENVVCL